ncbi:MAG: ABC transporter permease [Planctomycetota bacterium]|nr:ABC transporter permease [Planctomycetota bacterium]MDA1141374.1 ABC transporter permease [Planctomycetota bacterium]
MSNEKPQQLSDKSRTMVPLARIFGIWSGLILLCLFFTIAIPDDAETGRVGFLSTANFTNIFRQITIVAIPAIGATFVILTAGIDLSVGSVVAVSGMVMAGIFRDVDGGGLFLGICACMAAGTLFGLLNGLLVTLGGIHSFVATLGTMAIARSLARVNNDGVQIGNLPDSFGFFSQGNTPFFIMAGLYLLAWCVLRWTLFGRLVFAIGSNKEACRLAGINVRLHETLVYVAAGLCAALGSIVLTSRVGSAGPRAGLGLELDVIAAVVIGGTSLAGGRGGIGGTFCGALLMGVLGNGLNLLDVNPDWKGVIVGLIIITAVVIDRWGQSGRE